MALNAEKFFQAGNGVISREQRAADRFHGFKDQRFLFPSVDNDHRLLVGEFA